MKCIHCGADSDYRTRQDKQGRCGSCGRSFAFEPKEYGSPGITDGWFQAFLSRVSAEGSVRLTEKQLYYAYARSRYRKLRDAAGCAGVGLLVVAGVASVVVAATVSHWWPVPVGLALGVVGWLATYLRAKRRLAAQPTPSLALTDFRSQVLQPWMKAHGRPECLVDPDAEPPRPAGQEPDLEAYSFERVIVTDRKRAAALLVANNVHVEGRTAILSVDGYPEGRADRIREMLRRNETLVVIALHDASPRGVRLLQTLRQNQWFPGARVTHIDLGLRPRDAMRTRALCLSGQTVDGERRAAIDEALAQGVIDAAEAEWLRAGFVCELEAMPWPVLQRAINHVFARLGRASLDPGGDSDTSSAASDSSGGAATAAAFGVGVGVGVGVATGAGMSDTTVGSAIGDLDVSGAWGDDGGLGDGGDDGDG